MLFFFFAACKKENALDCFKSTGSEVTSSRMPGEFNIIKVYDKIDLNITKGTEFRVDVIAGKNIIKNIKTKVTDGVLIIDNNNKCNFVRGYKRKVTVNVTLPYLVRVENHGVGTTSFTEGFTQDTIQVRAENSGDIKVNGVFNQVKTSSHGNGDIYLNGSCNTLFVYTFGTNVLYGENLTIGTYLFIETISIGDCYINAPNGGKFDYNIWRSGNIYYKGNPAQINKTNGDGKGTLIKQD